MSVRGPKWEENVRRYAPVALALLAAFGCGGEKSTEENAKSASATKEAEVEYVYAGEWGSTGSGEGQFYSPNEIAVGPDGTVYVVNDRGARAQYFDRSGNYLGRLEGPVVSEFGEAPVSVAVAPDGIIYVGYMYGLVGGVKRFTRTGSYLGDPPGDFDWLITGDVAPNGNVYVAEEGADRIRYFSPAGSLLGSWGSTGAGEGQFQNPNDIAVAPNGWVYVVDSFNYRVQYFAADGSFLGQIRFYYEPFRFARGVAVAANGDVYVADNHNNRVVHLTADGAAVGTWGKEGAGDGEFDIMGKIAVGPEGDVYVADWGKGCIHRFTADGSFVRRYGGRGRLSLPEGVAVSPDGVIYVTDTGNHTVLYFSPQGEFLGGWGSEGNGDGEFKRPEDVAVAADGTVYVYDKGNTRIQYFTPNGSFLGKWYQETERGPSHSWGGVAVGPNGYVYVTDSVVDRVNYYTPTGSLLGQWGPEIPGDRSFSPVGVAASPNGNVYTIECDTLRCFTSTGSFISEKGPWAGADAPFRQPTKVAVGPNGDVFVCGQWDEGIIAWYSPLGRLKGSFGSPGSGPGQFDGYSAVAVGPNGTVYVADSGNDRVQYFRVLAGGQGDPGQTREAREPAVTGAVNRQRGPGE
jgi:DNA-binding beta-propeller fold protein YncE